MEQRILAPHAAIPCTSPPEKPVPCRLLCHACGHLFHGEPACRSCLRAAAGKPEHRGWLAEWKAKRAADRAARMVAKREATR